jgi:predicted RNA-binding Zn ribbon-like protein
MQQISTPFSLDRLRMVADRPALNFVNTVDPREGSETIDYLKTYADLTSWAVFAGVVSREVASRLISLARQDSAHAEKALQSAIRLREAMYRIFSGLAAHGRAERSDLALLRNAFYEALGRADLEQRGRSFRWCLRADLDLIRGSVARDAVALLESGALKRLKRCPGSADCGWLFLDTSKNASRRWCSMAGCGNRAKARRHLRKIGARPASLHPRLSSRMRRTTRRA